MSSLYEINNKINEILEKGFNTECIDFETGEILTDKVNNLLEELEVDRTTKVENIGLYIKNLEAEAEAIKQEEAILKERRQAKEKKIDSLKEYLTQNMQLFEQAKFETPKLALSFRKSVAVAVDNIEEIPEIYLKQKIEYVADKTEIKKALQNGEEIQGARLVEKQNLQIK